MDKQEKKMVRSHSQEREWLRDRGNGNIVEGVRSLIEESRTKTKRAGKNGKTKK